MSVMQTSFSSVINFSFNFPDSSVLCLHRFIFFYRHNFSSYTILAEYFFVFYDSFSFMVIIFIYSSCCLLLFIFLQNYVINSSKTQDMSLKSLCVLYFDNIYHCHQSHHHLCQPGLWCFTWTLAFVAIFTCCCNDYCTNWETNASDYAGDAGSGSRSGVAGRAAAIPIRNFTPTFTNLHLNSAWVKNCPNLSSTHGNHHNSSSSSLVFYSVLVTKLTLALQLSVPVPWVWSLSCWDDVMFLNKFFSV